MKQYFIFLFLLTLFACANRGAGPQGGPKDETPPKLKLNESTKNFQTNFEKQDIELVFDEYVEIKDAFNQVIISPPLEKRWKLSKKLKTVKFEFDKDEVLRPDATYTINFGEAVEDYTAGNKVPDLRFVFSTGEFIDSMEVSGTIVDAVTAKPVENILLMLYDNLSDTVVRTKRPFYFARTDKAGQYKIQNVKADTFKVFAIKDEGQQYLFDQETELIGFPDSVIILSDNQETIPPISIFLERPSLRLTPPKNNQYGRVALKFNQDPYDAKITYDDIGQQVFQETEQDSILFWYNQSDTSSWNIFIEQGSTFKDTFLVKPPDKLAFLEKDSLKRDNARKAASINLNPKNPVKILLNHPLSKVDSTAVLLFEDSTLIPVTPQLAIEGKQLVVNYPWKEAMLYKLQILPGALTDFFELQNQDTIQQDYQVMERKAFGDLRLKVLDLLPDQQYVINLYFKNNTNLVESMPVSGQATFEKYFKTISAGQYLVEIITDLNGNGRWDTGSYDEKSQPEPFFTKNLKEILENWEIDSEVSIKE